MTGNDSGLSPLAAGRRRSLVPYLGLVLLFQVAALAGRTLVLNRPARIAPFSPADAERQVVAWRRSVAILARDPQPGSQSLPLRLRTATGGELNLRQLAGRKVAVVFARDVHS